MTPSDRIDELRREVEHLRWTLYVFAASAVSIVSGLSLLLLTR